MEPTRLEPWGHQWAGNLTQHTIISEALRGNPLGDPFERPLLVYTPPGYQEGTMRYPSVYLIQGLTGQVTMWNNRSPFKRTTPELIDAGMADGGIPPAIVVFVDAWTALGGSQFLDSPATGSYHTYLCDEIVPWIDERFRTDARRERRAIAGKSSGGYGAMVTPMLRPDLFSGLATHAGDALFEHAYWPDVREAMRALRDEYEGSYDRFWNDLRARPGRPKRSDGTLLNVWTMAACYSADADGTVRLPWDAWGRIDHNVWNRWLEWDPVRMARSRAEALRSMRAIWIDAGRSDEFFLDLGASAFRDAVIAAGVPASSLHFELFDGTHSNIDWRYPLAVGWLIQQLMES
jgi:S-formylglutathione hydrolase FrmB